MSSSGNVKVLVYWYVPSSPDFESLEISRGAPATVVAGTNAQYSVRSKDPIGWTAAAVQIFDYHEKWLATGIATVYCSLQGKAGGAS
jgi:hypothetical protein